MAWRNLTISRFILISILNQTSLNTFIKDFMVWSIFWTFVYRKIINSPTRHNPQSFLCYLKWKHYNTKSSRSGKSSSSKQGKTTVIVGNFIKKIILRKTLGRRLKQNFIVRSFPGAKLEQFRSCNYKMWNKQSKGGCFSRVNCQRENWPERPSSQPQIR